MLWFFVGALLTAGLVVGLAFVPAPARTRWEALVIVQGPSTQQFYHRFTFKASGRREARVKALRLAGRRFNGWGVQLSEVEVSK